MVKQKQRQELSSDLYGEDSWVMVKKQRVTILIPPLPIANESTTPIFRPKELQSISIKTICDPAEVPVNSRPEVPSVNEQAKVISCSAPERITQITREDPAEKFSTFANHKRRIVSNSPKPFKQQKLLRVQCSLLDVGLLLNQRLRALNLERKLKNAGGLSRWLESLGLEQFVQIFRGKIVSKFQLANLTMKKLKDLGANAVGPRRKLMHAIDCISHHHCFDGFTAD